MIRKDEVMSQKKAHWDKIYTSKDYKEVGWYQATPAISLELLSKIKANPSQAVIDVGCGASVLVDALILQGFRNLTLLDLSEAALATVKARLGHQGDIPRYLVGDITLNLELSHQAEIWHDRAVFHFLTDNNDRKVYMNNLEKTLSPSGHAIIGTFSVNGPDSCSGLNVVQYDEKKMKMELPASFILLETQISVHIMPGGKEQEYMYFVIQKNNEAD